MILKTVLAACKFKPFCFAVLCVCFLNILQPIIEIPVGKIDPVKYISFYFFVRQKPISYPYVVLCQKDGSVVKY